jgi:hypothetical protein
MLRIFCIIIALVPLLVATTAEDKEDVDTQKLDMPSRQLRGARHPFTSDNVLPDIANRSLPSLKDAGEPLNEDQWDVMNNRDLFFMEMALKMTQPNGQWGDNPNGIANQAAYTYQPGGVNDFVNSYIADIGSMTLVAHDTYVFPAEAVNPYPAPRWSVVRISRKNGTSGDVLIISFRGSSGDPAASTSIDWNTFDADIDSSSVTQNDGVRFTKGFFDESLCVMMANGLHDAISLGAVGASEIFTVGHSLGGAWASILMSRITPNQDMRCPENTVFNLDFGLSAHAVTFGKPAPFYADRDPGYNVVERETDYVYHADVVARASSHSAATIGCRGVTGKVCWALLENLHNPCFKPGLTHNIENLFHGNTRTIWILNQLTAPFLPHSGNFPKSQRDNIVSYSTDIARADGINLRFVANALSEGDAQSVVAAGGEEHGEAYNTVPWNLQ